MEYVPYNAGYAEFELLSNVFLMQLKSICNRHQKNCITLYQLFENPVLHLLSLMLHKDRRFVTYMEKYGWAKIKEEMGKLI